MADYEEDRARKAREKIDAAMREADERAERKEAESKPLEPLPLLEFSDYIASFTAPDYLIDKILIAGRLYSLTAATGHLKTALATYMALSVACGAKMAGLDVRQCKVLFMSGENDEDQKSRTIATSQAFGLVPPPGYFHVMSKAQGIGGLISRLKDINEQHGPFGFIVTDTSIAYYGGTEENSNTEQQQHAEFFRELTKMPGNPTALVLCHPTKSPNKDNLLPRGGGAFLNAVDGNLTLWRSGELATFSWQGKFRGATFDPLEFQMKLVTLVGHNDAKGNPIASVIVNPLTDEEFHKVSRQAWTDENNLLYEMLRFPQSSLREWAQGCGWVSLKGGPQASKVHGILTSLGLDQLAEKNRQGKWQLTDKGKKAAKEVDEQKFPL